MCGAPCQRRYCLGRPGRTPGRPRQRDNLRPGKLPPGHGEHGMVGAERGPETEAGALHVESAVAVQQALLAFTGNDRAKSQVPQVLVIQRLGGCPWRHPALSPMSRTRSRTQMCGLDQLMWCCNAAKGVSNSY